MSLSLLLVSFLSGILTILAPCVLPLLPVIIGGSLSKQDNKPPYLIIASLCISIVVFTLLIKVSTILIGISPDTLKYISAGLLFFLGLITIFPHLWEKISFKLGFGDSSNKFLFNASKKQGATKDILTGVALGPVFSSCSPTYFLILATVLPASFLNGLIALSIYALGLSLSLFIVSVVGQRLIKNLKWATNPEGAFKKVLGGLFILVALAIMTGVDKKIEIALLDAGFFDITKVERQLLEVTDMEDKMDEEFSAADSAATETEFPRYTELVNPTAYLNTDEEFLLEDLVGEKVILVDFMTYSCINCIRTFPFLNEWYDKYKDQGLEIVGIHTPEFAFERNIENVREALAEHEIVFPVALDNDKETWRAYQNRFWPRKYLIDINGNVIYDHIGEGAYETTEKKIQEALQERAELLNKDVQVSTDLIDLKAAAKKEKSPEIYLGSSRGEYEHLNHFPKEGDFTGEQPSSTELNKAYLVGDWEVSKEYIESKSNQSQFILPYTGRKAMSVITSENSATIKSQDHPDIEVTQDDLYTIHTNEEGSSTIQLTVPEGTRLFSLVFE